MTLQKGRDFILRIGDGLSPETFTPVVGVMTRRFAFSAQPIDVTDMGSARWRELAWSAGARELVVSASGFLRTSAADAAIRDAFLNQALRNWQVLAPGLGLFTGRFAVTGLVYLAAQEGEGEWEMTLTSASQILFSAG